MNDLISVIIPVYNAEKYIESCLNAVLGQSYENIEVIVINDGSTDNSLKIIKKLKDKRLKIIDRENCGAAYCRYQGAKIAKGKYIIFIDADDYIKPSYIKILHEQISKNKVDIVRCHFIKYKNGKGINEKSIIDEDKIFKKANYEPFIYDLLYNSIYFNSMCKQIINADILKNISIKNYDINYGEDVLYEMQIINNSKSIMIINDYLYFYRQNENSITYTKDLKIIKQKLLSICKLHQIQLENIKNSKIKNKNKYYNFVANKFLKTLYLQYCNLIKYSKNEEKTIKEIYNLESTNKLLNNLNKKIIEKNLFYKIGMKLISKKSIKTLKYYTKFIVLPLLNHHNKK